MEQSDLLIFLEVGIMQGFNTHRESFTQTLFETDARSNGKVKRRLILEPDLDGFKLQALSVFYRARGFRESFSSQPVDHFVFVCVDSESWSPVPLRCCRVLCQEGGSILLLMKQKMKSSLRLFITGHSEPFIIVSR